MIKRASQKNCGVLFLLLNATNLPKFRKRIVELVCVLVAEIRINPLRFRFRDNRFEWNTRIAQFLFVQSYEAVLRFTERRSHFDLAWVGTVNGKNLRHAVRFPEVIDDNSIVPLLVDDDFVEAKLFQKSMKLFYDLGFCSAVSGCVPCPP